MANYPFTPATNTFGIQVRKEQIGDSLENVVARFTKRIPINTDLGNIKEKLLKRLFNYIQSHRQRQIEEHNEAGEIRFTKKNNLYNAIANSSSIKIIPNDNGIRYVLSIGNVDFLNKFARYWKVLNYGGYTPPATYGYFGRGKAPGSTVRGREVFHHTNGYLGMNPYTWKNRKNGMSSYGNSSRLIPKKPITPMYYLNDMAKWFNMYMSAQRYKK